MPQATYIVFGAVFTALVAIALGRTMLRAANLELCRFEEEPVAFVAGSAVLSLLVFLLFLARLGRPPVFFAAGVLILGCSVWQGAWRARPRHLPAIPRLWKWLFATGFTTFTFATAGSAC